MAAVTCEKIVESRAGTGKPSSCGKAASPYRLAGKLTATPTALCLKHVPAFQQEGYAVERPDGVALPKLAPASDEIEGEDAADQLLLFGR